MENNLGRSSNLRSLVRPVSPLSRLGHVPLPAEMDSVAFSRNPGLSRSRSRSPVLASAVHLANRPNDSVSSHMDTAFGGEETRRIVIRHTDRDADSPPTTDDKRSERPLNMGTKPGGITQKVVEQSGRRSSQHLRPLKTPRALPSPSGIDRNQTCPILIRLSYSTNGRHTSLSEYDRGRFPVNEIDISTWVDCSLRELAYELRDVCPLARRRGTRLHFAVIYPDQRGTYRRRELGVVISGFAENEQTATDATTTRTNGKRGFHLMDDSSITLLSKRFHIGDYIDVAISEHVPGTLGGWSTGRRPLGPTPVSSTAAAKLI
ncbi:unnamed protein product [Calicophoron daubneyi]|uniref:18 kDa Sin3-associated polypeptide n=1 Tax=Calicophoron daubneyi TaxID=300641 RepID=A0AAV2TEE2_CALDB